MLDVFFVGTLLHWTEEVEIAGRKFEVICWPGRTLPAVYEEVDDGFLGRMVDSRP
jgi:hypothetical protein